MKNRKRWKSSCVTRAGHAAFAHEPSRFSFTAISISFSNAADAAATQPRRQLNDGA